MHPSVLWQCIKLSIRPFLCLHTYNHPSNRSYIHTTNETLHIVALVACRPATLGMYLICCMHLFATCIATQCDTMTDDHLHTIRLNALNDCGILCFCDCRLLFFFLLQLSTGILTQWMNDCEWIFFILISNMNEMNNNNNKNIGCKYSIILLS